MGKNSYQTYPYFLFLFYFILFYFIIFFLSHNMKILIFAFSLSFFIFLLTIPTTILFYDFYPIQSGGDE